MKAFGRDPGAYQMLWCISLVSDIGCNAVRRKIARLVEMPDSQSSDQFNSRDWLSDDSMNRSGQETDGLMEDILENINATPIGRVLRRIGSLPEIRKGKVFNLRRQITDGTYDEGDHLDAALDRVIEDYTTQ